MAILGEIGKSVYKGATSRTGLGLIAAGAIAKGLSDTVGKSSIKNAMEIAFDDRNADQMAIGTDLTPGLLLAESGIPIAGGLAKAANIDKYGFDIGATGAMAVPAVTGVIGAGIGSMGGLKGTLIGGAVGAAAGAYGVGKRIANYARNNKALMSQSNNTSLQMANNLNATGDIVLGMHNSRRGF